MSDGSNSGIPGPIPAGWYADPAGSDGKRWWDGSQWTSHVEAPAAPPPLPTFGNFVAPENRSFTPVPTADAGIAYTRTSWWIALSPIWCIVPQVFVFETINSITQAPFHSFIPDAIGISVLLWFVLLWLAILDRRALFAHGNETAAAPFWVFLTPLAYLIVRAQHVRLYALGGWASVIWFAVATILTPGLALLAVFASYGLFAT